jgi:hypothetical protein
MDAKAKQVRALLRRMKLRDWVRTDFILTYLGCKYATDILLGDSTFAKPESRAAQIRYERDLLALCTAAHMVCVKSPNETRGWDKHSFWTVARSKEDALKLKRLNVPGRTGQLTIGRMYGFPDTAARAFQKGQKHLVPVSHGIHVLPDSVIRESYMAYAQLRFSKKHWRAELRTVRAWADAIKAFDPELYRRDVAEYRRWLANYKKAQRLKKKSAVQ